jgi:hypothetical protein
MPREWRLFFKNLGSDKINTSIGQHGAHYSLSELDIPATFRSKCVDCNSSASQPAYAYAFGQGQGATEYGALKRPWRCAMRAIENIRASRRAGANILNPFTGEPRRPFI